jgi:2-octaprenylphenol hydroxylase
MKEYDVIIVGGGLVGAALACALAGQRLRIAMVEAETPAPPDDNEFDLRVSAVTRATQCMLENIGAWQAIGASRRYPFRDMHVWDASGSGVIHFDSADIGEATLGHIIENRIMLQAMLMQLDRTHDVERFVPAKPQALEIRDDGVTLRLDTGDELQARLLIGADGARSWVREQCGIHVTATDYQQRGVVATIKTEKGHFDTAWQRFLPTGPLAILPLAGAYSSIVWTTTPEHAEHLLNAGDTDFRRELTEAFENRLGAVVSASPRAAFPLHAQHADQYVQPRVALIGDAAHTIHPLAGQGVNLGFADAAALAEVVMDAAQKRRDIGGIGVLRRYERWRKGDNLAMLQIMTGFQRLFGSRATSLRQVRNFGLNLVDRLGPVKNLIIRRAMGLAGDLPRLARRLDRESA